MAFNSRTGVIESDIQLEGKGTLGQLVKKVESRDWGTFEVYQYLDVADSTMSTSLQVDFRNNTSLPSAWVEINDTQGNSYLLGQLIKTGIQSFKLPASYTSEETWQLSIQDKIKHNTLYQTDL